MVAKVAKKTGSATTGMLAAMRCLLEIEQIDVKEHSIHVGWYYPSMPKCAVCHIERGHYESWLRQAGHLTEYYETTNAAGELIEINNRINAETYWLMTDMCDKHEHMKAYLLTDHATSKPLNTIPVQAIVHAKTA